MHSCAAASSSHAPSRSPPPPPPLSPLAARTRTKCAAPLFLSGVCAAHSAANGQYVALGHTASGAPYYGLVEKRRALDESDAEGKSEGEHAYYIYWDHHCGSIDPADFALDDKWILDTDRPDPNRLFNLDGHYEDNDEGGRPAETPGSLARQPWSIAKSLPPDESPAPLPPGLPPTSSTSSSVRSRHGHPSQSPGRRASGLDKVSEIMEHGDRIVTKLLRTKSTVQMAIEQSGKISTDVEQSSRMCCCLVFLSIMLLLLILCSAMIYLEFVDSEAVQSHADAAVAAAGEYVPNGESLRAAIPFVPEPEPTSTYDKHRQTVKSWIAMSP